MVSICLITNTSNILTQRCRTLKKATPEDLAAEPSTLEGPLQKTFHPRTRGWNLWPIFLLMFPASLDVVAIFAIPDIVGKLICFIPGTLPLCIYVWSLVSDHRDEMRIFENGFSYRHKGQTVECLWDQIEDYSMAGVTHSKVPDLIESIKKDNGPWIQIAMDMQGKEFLEPHLRTLLKWKGVEE